MKSIYLTAISAALLGLGCTISPNVVAPESARGGALYSDCRRAARDVCKHQAFDGSGEKTCVAEKTYDCVRGGAR